ncbi:MAG: hypothetical protein RJA70_3163, partial [Pseudomonadota bacterium]
STPPSNLPRVNLPEVNLPEVNLPEVNLPEVCLSCVLTALWPCPNRLMRRSCDSAKRRLLLTLSAQALKERAQAFPRGFGEDA